jgi:hypothetical protein
MGFRRPGAFKHGSLNGLCSFRAHPLVFAGLAKAVGGRAGGATAINAAHNDEFGSSTPK